MGNLTAGRGHCGCALVGGAARCRAVAAVLVTLWSVTACTIDGSEGDSSAGGTLSGEELPGDGWSEVDGAPDPLGLKCGTMGRELQILRQAEEDGGSTYWSRDDVVVESEAWLVPSGTGDAAAASLDALAAAAGVCASDDPATDGGVPQLSVERAYIDLVVQETAVVRGEEVHADLAASTEGGAVVVVKVLYGDEATDVPDAGSLLDPARSKAVILSARRA